MTFVSTYPDRIPSILADIDLVGLVERYTGGPGRRDGARLRWACHTPTTPTPTPHSWSTLANARRTSTATGAAGAETPSPSSWASRGYRGLKRSND
jgi:hypothetical protein